MSPISNTGGGSGVVPVAFGLAAARPAASAANANTAWFATDSGEVTFSDGAAWHPIGATSAANFNLTVGQLQFGGSNTLKIGTPAGGILGVQGAHWGVGLLGPGSGLRVAEGIGGKQGTYGPLVAGTLAVANTSVTANSRIFVCRGAGGTNPGAHSVSVQTAGTGFTVVSTNAADTGSGVFQIFEPA